MKLHPIHQPVATKLKLAQPILDVDSGEHLFLVSQDDTTIGEIRVDLYAMHSSDGWQLMAVCPTGTNLNLQSALVEEQLQRLEAWLNDNIPFSLDRAA